MDLPFYSTGLSDSFPDCLLDRGVPNSLPYLKIYQYVAGDRQHVDKNGYETDWDLMRLAGGFAQLHAAFSPGCTNIHTI